MGNVCFRPDFAGVIDSNDKAPEPSPSETSTHDRSNLEEPHLHYGDAQHHQVRSRQLGTETCVGMDERVEAIPLAAQFSWQRGRQIGQGAFGTVYMALVPATGQEVAVKQVSLPRGAAQNGRVSGYIQSLEREVDVLRSLRHENIVRYLGTERTDEHLNIFLEYVAGGPISEKLTQFGSLREETIRVYTKQILRGLEYLHQQKVMHRDIKGANILVDTNGVVKLADFGASKKIENLATIGGGARSLHGTAHWMAPEILRGGATCASDIWSLACVVIEMATGQPPWADFGDPMAVMFHVASTREPPPLPSHLSAHAKDFLTLCFNRVPRERPEATRLLQHPWLHGVAVPRSSLPPPVLVPVSEPAPPRMPGALQQQQPQEMQPPPRAGRMPCGGEGSSCPAASPLPSYAPAAKPLAFPPAIGLPLPAPELPLLWPPLHQPGASTHYHEPCGEEPQLAASLSPVPAPGMGDVASSRGSGAGQPDSNCIGLPLTGQDRDIQARVAPALMPATAPLLAPLAAVSQGDTPLLMPEGPVHSPTGPDHALCTQLGVDFGHPRIAGHGGRFAGCRESTVTLSGFNPVEEPAWAPAQAASTKGPRDHMAPVSEDTSVNSPSSDADDTAATPACRASSSEGTTDSSSGRGAHCADRRCSSMGGGGVGNGCSGDAPPDLGPLLPALSADDEVLVLVSPCSGGSGAGGCSAGVGTEEPGEEPEVGRCSAAAVVSPIQAALAALLDEPCEGGAPGALAEFDQLSPAPRTAAAAAFAHSATPTVMARQSTAHHGARQHVSASRRALEEAGILGGTLDASRAKQWREELVAELQAERMRALGTAQQQQLGDTERLTGRASVPAAVTYGAPTRRVRPSVADLF